MIPIHGSALNLSSRGIQGLRYVKLLPTWGGRVHVNDAAFADKFEAVHDSIGRHGFSET
jgi:hypothetical protein